MFSRGKFTLNICLDETSTFQNSIWYILSYTLCAKPGECSKGVYISGLCTGFTSVHSFCLFGWVFLTCVTSQCDIWHQPGPVGLWGLCAAPQPPHHQRAPGATSARLHFSSFTELGETAVSSEWWLEVRAYFPAQELNLDSQRENRES